MGQALRWTCRIALGATVGYLAAFWLGYHLPSSAYQAIRQDIAKRGQPTAAVSYVPSGTVTVDGAILNMSPPEREVVLNKIAADITKNHRLSGWVPSHPIGTGGGK